VSSQPARVKRGCCIAFLPATALSQTYIISCDSLFRHHNCNRLCTIYTTRSNNTKGRLLSSLQEAQLSTPLLDIVIMVYQGYGKSYESCSKCQSRLSVVAGGQVRKRHKYKLGPPVLTRRLNVNEKLVNKSLAWSTQV